MVANWPARLDAAPRRAKHGRMNVRRAGSADLSDLARLRHGLWPHHSEADHRAELEPKLVDRAGETAIFLACSPAQIALGFAEASLRRDYVNGCDTSPVAFLEGIYVEPASRRGGVARALAAAVEAWGAALGCSELASDATLDNEGSHRMHAALGFEETERIVFFRKTLV
jgi:aminoglycoside 6'-N-acetyltransferase I